MPTKRRAERRLPADRLPVPLTPILGRARDLDESSQRLTETRLLSLTGPAEAARRSTPSSGHCRGAESNREDAARLARAIESRPATTQLHAWIVAGEA